MSSSASNSAFVIGVTGYMDIPAIDRPVIRDRLRTVFRWLREPPRREGAEIEPDCESPHREAWWPRFDTVSAPASDRHSSPSGGLGLGKQRIVLLTSLAPGADSIAAQIALDEGIEVVAPLPFPADSYRRSSSFCGETVEPGAQQVFDSLIADTSRPIEAFPVLLHTDQELDPDARGEGFRADLDDSERCNLRYRAAGEFIATHSHLLIALYDVDDDLSSNLETGAGTASIVHVRRSVPSVRIVPRPDEFPWAECGPVLQLRARSLKRIADPTSIDRDTTWQDTPARFLPPYPIDVQPSQPADAPTPGAIAAAYTELREIARSLTGD